MRHLPTLYFTSLTLLASSLFYASSAHAQQPAPGGEPQQSLQPQSSVPTQLTYQPQPNYQPQPSYQPQQVGFGPSAPSPMRSSGEMTALYVSSAIWGVGSGIWLDSLFKIDNPGGAIVMPLLLGAAAPVGVFFWDDRGGPLHRGVPLSTSTGLVLGAVEGLAISGVQWQYTHEKDKDWKFSTQTSVMWLFATAGGVGGWAFGEAVRPDPRSMSFIASGAGWGALSGSMLGIAVSGKDWKDGASVAGLVGYNLGILGAGALSLVHTPSWESQKYMWLGYGAGALAGCLVFPFYLFAQDSDAKTGFIGPALGGLAGVGIAGALTASLKDPEDRMGKSFKAPFDIAVLPAPKLDPSQSQVRGESPGGAMLTGLGTF